MSLRSCGAKIESRASACGLGYVLMVLGPLSAAAVVLTRLAVKKLLPDFQFSWVNIAVSSFMALLFGVFARLIYHA